MAYESKIEEVSTTRRKFTITVPRNAVSEAFTATIDELRATADVRGFRKGKVPANVIRKFFKSDIFNRTAEKIINQSYFEVIKGSDAQIVSQPEIEAKEELQEDKDFTYVATVDVSPPIDIQGYKELTLKGIDTRIGDEDADKAIANMARSIAKTLPVAEERAIVEGDLVTVNLSVETDGQVNPDVSRDGLRFALGYDPLLPEYRDNLLGAKVGDVRDFTVKYPDDYAVASLAGKEAKVTATVTKLEALDMPELDDAFAKRIGAPSMEALRKSVRDSLIRTEESKKVDEFGRQIVEQLLEKNKFEVPESLVDSTIDRLIEEANQRVGKDARVDPRNESARTHFRETARSEVQSVLAIGNVARMEGLKVEDAEAAEELMELARSFGTSPQNLIKQGGRMVLQEAQGRALIKKTIKHLVGINKVEYT